MKRRAVMIALLLFVILAAACTAGSDDQTATGDSESLFLPTAQVSQNTPIPAVEPSGTGQSSAPAGSATATPEMVEVEPGALNITVDTDQSSYQTGDDILVSIRNHSQIPAYPLTSDSGCVELSIQKKQGEEWRSQDLCLVSSRGGELVIQEGSWEFVISGPTLSVQQTGAVVFDGDIRDLPTITPHPPGYSGPEIPRGPSEQVDPPTNDGQLAYLTPGTYRIGFVFYQAAVDGVLNAVYSPEFLISS